MTLTRKKPVKRKKAPKRSTLTKKADRLVSLKVRSRGYCELKALAPELACLGNLQCCHIIGRRFRSTRWSEDNLLAGCQAHHVLFTHRPEAFFLAVEKAWPGRWQELWDRAQIQWSGDLGAVLSTLTEDG